MIFLALFFFPALLCLRRRRALVVLSPIAGLVVSVLAATGEVRYRIPFDAFFMTVAAALYTRELHVDP